jgi:hypothetical protein
MNETELLARLRAEIPFEDASPEAERLFRAGLEDAAGGADRTRGFAARWRGAGRSLRTRRLVLAGGLSLAVAAGAVAAGGVIGIPGRAVTAVPDPGGAHVAPAVREVAYRAAAAAGQQPPVQPGQWVYWKEMTDDGTGPQSFEVWTTADQTKAAFVDNGKLYPVDFVPPHGQITTCSANPCKQVSISRSQYLKELGKQFIGQPRGTVIPAAHGGGTDFTGETGTLPVQYADLGSLPGSPDALNRYFGGLAARDPGPQEPNEFLDIEDLLISYVMPPNLTAELYRVLGNIPGVTLSEHAMDIAGRPGLGIVSPPFADGSREEIIFNPSSYQLMGQSQLDLGPPTPTGAKVGEAILGEALVSGPGVRP